MNVLKSWYYEASRVTKKMITVFLLESFIIGVISVAKLKKFIALITFEKTTQTPKFLANFLFLISLAIDDPSKPHPTMVILLNIKKSYPTA